MGINWQTVNKLTETRTGLFFIIFLSIILRGAIIISQPDAVINNDAVRYISVAKQFAMGHVREGLAIYPMPFYSSLIALVHYFVPNWSIAARLISLASLVLVLIPLYMLITDLFNHRAAFWGCLMFALSPLSMRLTPEIMREPIFALFFVSAVYFAQKAVHSKRMVDLLATAAFSSVSILCRLEGIILFPVYFFTLIGLAILKRAEMKIYLRRALVWFAFVLCLLTTIFVMGKPANTATNRYGEYGEQVEGFLELGFLHNYRHIHAQLEHMEEASPHGWCQNFAGTAKRFIGTIYLLGLLQYLVEAVFVVNMVPLVWGLRRSPLGEIHVFVLILAVSYLAMIYYFFVQNDFLVERFLFLPALMMYAWVGMGIGKMLDFIRRLSYGKLLTTIVIIVLLTAPVNKFNHLYKKGDNAVVQAGTWLANEPELAEARIIATDPRIFYYAGRDYMLDKTGKNIRWINQGDETFSGLEQVALRKNMDVIVVLTDLGGEVALDDSQKYRKLKEFIGRNEKVDIYRASGYVSDTKDIR
jgi:4-amino-4-deoxy-L-arabinose transferase-like glycosyltransferase